MKINMMKSNIKQVGLGLILAGGFALASVASVSAQNAPPPTDAPRPARNAPRPPRPDERAPVGDPAMGMPNGDVYARAREQGMRDGQLVGADDRSDGDEFRPEKSGKYKKATNGYSRSNGDKNAYREAYREGFRRGYENAYRGEKPGMPNGAMPDDRPAPPPAGERPPRPEGRPKPPVKDGKRPKPPVDDPERRDAPPATPPSV